MAGFAERLKAAFGEEQGKMPERLIAWEQADLVTRVARGIVTGYMEAKDTFFKDTVHDTAGPKMDRLAVNFSLQELSEITSSNMSGEARTYISKMESEMADILGPQFQKSTVVFFHNWSYRFEGDKSWRGTMAPRIGMSVYIHPKGVSGNGGYGYYDLSCAGSRYDLKFVYSKGKDGGPAKVRVAHLMSNDPQIVEMMYRRGMRN